MRIPILLAALLAASPALAQLPAKRFSGTVDSFDGTTLVVKLRNGSPATILVPPDARIGALANRTLADIKPGEFVGSAAVKGTDGKLHAQEVHIFPEAMRGTGEGNRPMDEPGQSMTNANVAEVAAASSGTALILKYPGGEQTIDVAPGTRIVELIPGDRTLLKPGAAVFASAKPNADGAYVAQYLQAEKDGVKPLF
jgi:hypothetical protein